MEHTSSYILIEELDADRVGYVLWWMPDREQGGGERRIERAQRAAMDGMVRDVVQYARDSFECDALLRCNSSVSGVDSGAVVGRIARCVRKTVVNAASWIR